VDGAEKLEISAVGFSQVTAVKDDANFELSSEFFRAEFEEFLVDVLSTDLTSFVAFADQTSNSFFSVWNSSGLRCSSSDLTDFGCAAAEDTGDGGIEAFAEALVFEQVVVGLGEVGDGFERRESLSWIEYTDFCPYLKCIKLTNSEYRAIL
jgi:hypothetical protein